MTWHFIHRILNITEILSKPLFKTSEFLSDWLFIYFISKGNRDESQTVDISLAKQDAQVRTDYPFFILLLHVLSSKGSH